MAFVNFKAKENSEKCESCRLNFIHKYKKDEQKSSHFFNLTKVAQGAMWVTCKPCPVRKDFLKMYGVEPVAYFSTAAN